MTTTTSQSADIARLLSPGRIAVVGASDDIVRIRGRVMHLLLKRGYTGEVFPVTPSRAEVQGLKAYPRVGDVPGGVDLALVAVPANLVLGVLEDCAAAKVGAAVIFSSGFAEEGGEMADKSRVAWSDSRIGAACLRPTLSGRRAA